MGSTDSELSQDVVFDVLSSPRRRYVLYYLRTHETPVKLTDLAEQVAAWENDTVTEEITEQERKRVYVSLYQTHIPHLADVGIIDYDKESGNIALAEDAINIDDYLSSSSEAVPWQQIYLLLAGASVVLLGLTVFDIALFVNVPDPVASVLVVVAFVVTAVAHSIVRLRQRRAVPPELQK